MAETGGSASGGSAPGGGVVTPPRKSGKDGVSTTVVSGESEVALSTVSMLLGVDVTQLRQAITTKILVVDGANIEIGRSRTDALSVRDALAKHVYRRVWSWVLLTLNCHLDHNPGPGETAAPATAASTRGRQRPASPAPPLSPNSPNSAHTSTLSNYGFIGLLDIYGFEALEHNGFDQLLINYANEVCQHDQILTFKCLSCYSGRIRIAWYGVRTTRVMIPYGDSRPSSQITHALFFTLAPTCAPSSRLSLSRSPSSGLGPTMALQLLYLRGRDARVRA